MMNIRDYITINPEILGGQPVFKNTRVPLESIFDHLEKGETLDSFLEDFPSVNKEQAIAVIEIAAKLMSSGDIIKFYETAA
jgi:uncharacterized protein (DUF433 family)